MERDWEAVKLAVFPFACLAAWREPIIHLNDPQIFLKRQQFKVPVREVAGRVCVIFPGCQYPTTVRCSIHR